MNLTDVDDKTIARRRRRRGCRSPTSRRKYADLSSGTSTGSGIQRAERYPRATEHIPEMQEITAKLLERGHAYESEGSVYFRISTFPGLRQALGHRPRRRRAAATASPTTSTRRRTSRTSSSGRPRSPGSRRWPSPWGAGPAGLAHRVLGDEHEVPRTSLRHPHGRASTTSSRTTRTRSRRARRRRGSRSWTSGSTPST